MYNAGDFDTTETVHIPVNSFSSDDPTASITMTNLAAGDVEIHKDGSTTQRSSDSGVTVTIDFDGVTGNHLINIDLSDNTDAGYYSAGSRYLVRVEGITVDGGTINAWVGGFSIGCILRPTTAGRKLDVETGGCAGIDWANVANPTTSVDLSATAIDLVDECTTNTDMRGTDSAALASVVGALADAAADGDPTSADTIMQYVKQLINVLMGSTGIASFPAASPPGDGVSLAEVIRSTYLGLTAIANVGAAVNKPASSYTLTTGTQSANLYTDTYALNGTRHTHTDVGGSIDLYYEFLIGGGTPASVTLTGALTGINDNLKVYGYDWITTSWVQIGTLVGKTLTDNEVDSFQLFVNMVGTGSDLGKVRIRFYDDDYTLTSATLYIDQIFVTFSQGTGDYANGAIWVNTNITNTNTIVGVDGTSTNPVSTWAAALTLSAATNIKKFQIVNGSSITLSANSDNYTLIGEEWDIALGGQSIEALAVYGANITGIGTATVKQPHFHNCHIGAATIPPSKLELCGIGDNSGQFTAGSAGQYVFKECYSLVPGSGVPTFVFSGLGATTGINIRGWLGGSNITLDSDCTMSLEVLVGGIQTITTGGANVEIRGICRALTVVMSSNETIQFSGIAGVITLSGTTTGIVNLYGVSGTVTDNTVTATVNNYTVSATQQDLQALAATALSNSTWTDAKAAFIDGSILSRSSHSAADVVNEWETQSQADPTGFHVNVLEVNGTAQTANDNGADINTLITQVGTAGNGLSAIPWNSAWDVEAQSEVNDALVAFFTSSAQLVDDIWDEVLTAATHNIATSAGRRVRELAGVSIHAGVAVAGGNNTITLDGAASTTDHIYNQCLIAITNGGTGSGQCRLITEYDGTTQTATVDRNWEINPDATSEFQIVGFSGILLTGHGIAQAGAAGTITLSAASIAVNDAYNGSMIVISTGTGAGQARLIIDYDGTSFIATISPNWTITPDNTSVYKIIPVGRSIVESIKDGAITKDSFNADIKTGDYLNAHVKSTEAGGDATSAKQDTIIGHVQGLAGAAMRGTDNAALAATALSNTVWTNAKAAFIDGSILSRSSHSAADVWAAATRTLTAIPTGGATEAKQDIIIADTDFLQKIENGDWELVEPNQLYFYEAGTRTGPGAGTILATFNCYDSSGVATVTDIARVERVV